MMRVSPWLIIQGASQKESRFAQTDQLAHTIAPCNYAARPDRLRVRLTGHRPCGRPQAEEMH